MIKRLLSSLLLLSSFFTSYSQRYLGVSTSNYNALNSLYINPANLGGCNEKLGISLFSFNMGADNNLGTIASIGDITKTLKSGESGADGVFTFSDRNKFSLALPVVEVRGPGVLYRINSQHTLAVTSRVRAFNELDNFDRTLYRTITEADYAKQGVNSLKAQDFNWTAHVWSEFGLSYGGVIMSTDMMAVKVGATVRYLAGVGYLGLKGKNLDIYYQNGSDSFAAKNSDIEFASNAQSLSDAFTNGGITTSSLFGGNTGGKGFGADLGVIVSLLPEEEEDEKKTKLEDAAGDVKSHRLSLSAAITDIGSITYNTSYNVNVTGNGYLTGRGLTDHMKDYDDFRAYAKGQGYTADTGVKSTKVYMPTVLSIGGDFHAYKHFYASALLFTSLTSNQNFGSRYYNQLTITPRFDSKILTVGLPLTFNMLTNNMRVGLGFRVTGFFFGSDDMMALFSGKQYGFNFYLGGMIPIFRRSA